MTTLRPDWRFDGRAQGVKIAAIPAAMTALAGFMCIDSIQTNK